MRFYIATGFSNSRKAELLSEVLIKRGHEHTLDRTRRSGAADVTDYSEYAFNELRAVRDSELVIALLPGGSETHTELGVAIATRSNKRVILWSETGAEFDPVNDPCAYYFHSCVERIACPFDELLLRLDKEQIGSDLK